MSEENEKKYNFIDLFAGCGGLSEGFYKENFNALAHIEINEIACKTLKTRMKYYGYSDEDIEKAVLCEDITKEETLTKLKEVVGEKTVDLIIGGPPCQAFSTQGRAQDPNSMKNDPRNYLFENYLTVLNYFKPKFFIFENVRGILTAKPNDVKIFDVIISKMRETYKVSNDVKTILLNAADYGVPQIRERVILIGVRNDLSVEPEEIYSKIVKTHSDSGIGNFLPYVTVRDAISDLPKLKPSEGADIVDFTETSLDSYVSKIRTTAFNKLYNHWARFHNVKDRERYKILSENKNWQLKDLQLVRPDLVNHDPKHFGNRYTVQEWDKPGKTVVAHLYKDGNLFIHPDSTQERTFTVREAARIQSFPDDFFFEGSRTEQFKQVGNAVPPLMALSFAKALKQTFEIIEKNEG